MQPMRALSQVLTAISLANVMGSATAQGFKF